jgi:hypothetical protein
MTLEKKYFSKRTHLKASLYTAFVNFVPFVLKKSARICGICGSVRLRPHRRGSKMQCETWNP